MPAGRLPARVEEDDALIRSLGILGIAWTSLALGVLLVPWLGREPALFGSFAAVAGMLVAIRPTRRPAVRWPRVFVSAFLAGLVSYPAWVVAIAWIGIAIGLPARLPVPPGAGSALSWLALVLFAPWFEELLYRERLLPVLRARFGVALAIVLSSLLFALPHLEAWNVLGVFVVGLGLGAAFARTGCTVLCIGCHAGLNSACLISGVPPVDPPLGPACGAILGGALLALSVRWSGERKPS